MKNKSKKTVKLFVRVAIPSAPYNRNYGFVAVIEPNDVFPFVCPSGSNIYACDGKYWADYRPKECLVLTADDSRDGVELDADWLIWKKDCKKIKTSDLPEMSRNMIPSSADKSKGTRNF